MKRDTTPARAAADSDAGGEGRAGERLTDRSARFVETLMQKLARHDRGAERLAAVLRRDRGNG